MLQNTDFEVMPHPLIRALRLQEYIKQTEMELEGAKTELSQILLYCKEKKITEDGDIALCINKRSVRTVDPKRFAELFPSDNVELLELFLTAEHVRLEEIQKAGVLPSIDVKDAEARVGKLKLEEAVHYKTYEKMIVKSGSE